MFPLRARDSNVLGLQAYFGLELSSLVKGSRIENTRSTGYWGYSLSYMYFNVGWLGSLTTGYGKFI